MKPFIQTLFFCLFGILMLGFSSSVSAAGLSWKTSCNVDRGAIKRKDRTWYFETSKNKCRGGHFKQRAELSTAHQKLAPNVRGAYMFESFISIRSASTQKFGFFQLHDGRYGCAPPLKVELTQQGRILLESDFKIGPAETDCIHNRSISSGQSAVRLKRNGTEYKVNILIDFDGSGNFDVVVWVNDAVQVTGRYEHPGNANYFKSPKFYFKHGSYSEHMFDYKMTSRDMRIRRVRIK